MKGSQRIASLFAEGSYFVSGPLQAVVRFHRIPTDATPVLRTGFSAPKSRLRRAVDRNRTKRRMRAVHRHHKHELLDAFSARRLEADMMWIARSSTVLSSAAIAERMARVRTQIIDYISEGLG